MIKNLISCLLFLFLICPAVRSQIVTSVVPDSGYQGTTFPISVNGSGTQWVNSTYYNIFFDSAGGMPTSNIHWVNDTLLTANLHIIGKMPIGWKWCLVIDPFQNPSNKDSAIRVLLTIPVIPTLILPPNNSTNQLQNPKFLWDSNKSAASFRIQISSDSAFVTGIVYDTSVANTPLQLRQDILALGMKYYWRVNASNILGTSGWSAIWNFIVRETGISVISSEIPSEYKLYNNFPNPFNPVTTIRYSIPYIRAGNIFVSLKIFNILGKEIATLVNQKQAPGMYQVSFNTVKLNLSSGIYFYRLITEDFEQTRRMAVVK